MCLQARGSPTGRPFWPELTVRSRADPAREQRCYDEWCARWKHDLAHSEGERWHRVVGDVGGSIGGESTHSARRAKEAERAAGGGHE